MDERDKSWLKASGQHISTTTDIYCSSGDGMHLAVSNQTNSIDLYACHISEHTMELVLTLEGHRATPKCLVFSHTTEPLMLISAADDYIIKWNITECLINHHNGIAVKGEVVMQSPTDDILGISWGYGRETLAICSGCHVIVHAVGTSRELHGHSDVVTCADFCPHYDFTLVTASADRTYMIWNVESYDLLHRSSIISSSPFEHLIMNQSREEFVLVARDGMVRFYDISSDSDFSQQTSIDIGKRLSMSMADCEETSYSCCVLALQLVSLPLDYGETESEPSPAHHMISSLFGSIHLLIVLTSSHILIFNTRSRDIITCSTLFEHGIGCLSSANTQSRGAIDDEDNGHIFKFVSRGMVGGKLMLVDVDLLKASQSSHTDGKGEMSTIAVKTKQSRGVKDQPLVYRTNVKSSGYSTTYPKRKMFQPKTGSKSSNTKTSSEPAKNSVKVYPSDVAPISRLKGETITVDARPTQIMAMDFSRDGQNLAVACSNGNVYAFRLPLNNKRCTVYSGHSGSVNSCKWSFHSHNLVTAGGAAVNVWNKDSENAVFTINKLQGNILDSSKRQSDQGLPGSAKHAQFYYLDKFILISSSESLLLYKYFIDSTKNDLKRYENGSRYKLVVQLGMESAHNVTSMSAINSFYSYLVLAAGSDKSIHVFDLNKSTKCRIIEDCHSKPANHLVQNEGSVYSSLPYSAYDLFMTSAIGDGVKLWDLRTQKCVRKLEAHTNKAFPCTCDFSPDGRYIAAGSEDKSIYIYDIGTGKVLSRVKGMSEICTDVLYHPLRAELGAGFIQGSVAMCEP